MNQVVARFADGRIVKGFTTDFIPGREIFHVTPAHSPVDSRPVKIPTGQLKALFFVRSFEGNPQYDDRKIFEPGHPVIGRKIRVLFKDGETMVGTTQGYQTGRPGFFLVPVDPKSNNKRCYIVCNSTVEIGFF